MYKLTAFIILSFISISCQKVNDTITGLPHGAINGKYYITESELPVGVDVSHQLQRIFDLVPTGTSIVFL